MTAFEKRTAPAERPTWAQSRPWRDRSSTSTLHPLQPFGSGPLNDPAPKAGIPQPPLPRAAKAAGVSRRCSRGPWSDMVMTFESLLGCCAPLSGPVRRLGAGRRRTGKWQGRVSVTGNAMRFSSGSKLAISTACYARRPQFAVSQFAVAQDAQRDDPGLATIQNPGGMSVHSGKPGPANGAGRAAATNGGEQGEDP